MTNRTKYKKNRNINIMIAILVMVIFGCAFYIICFYMANRLEITSEAFLKANGTEIKDNYGVGDPVILKGTNAGGWLLQEMWLSPTESTKLVKAESDLYEILEKRFGQDKMYELISTYQDAYWTEKDFDRCAKLGMNCIRLPFWYRNLVDNNGVFYGYDETAIDPYEIAFAKIDWFIQEAGERGIYVILDFHGAPGSQNGSDHSGVDGGDSKESVSEFFFGKNSLQNQKLFFDIWTVIAKRYEGNPVVAGYDILNEAFSSYRYDSSYTDEELHNILWNIYDTTYQNIRQVDKDHIVIMEAIWDPSDLPDPMQFGWENIMYEYHQYSFQDTMNERGLQISSIKAKLSAIESAGYDVPSYMGEFCFWDNLDAWKEGLQLLNDSNISWTTWTYKTVSEYGNWGLYHHTSDQMTINIEVDSQETIMKGWSSTGQVKKNDGIIKVFIDAMR